MRLISFSVTISLVLLLSDALAQQSPGTGDTIGHPPPIPGPPPISDPSSTMQPAPAASRPRASEPATFDAAILPQAYSGPGLNVPGPDGSTKTMKAVPCRTVLARPMAQRPALEFLSERSKGSSPNKRPSEGGLSVARMRL